jgi:Na+/H+ antiporter NhaD/arsenite permease-like protein
MLYLASKNGIDSKLLLLSLAFAVTIGGTMSPIGNPQNLLVAVNGEVDSPFVTFAGHLLLPTLINLFVAYVWLRMAYRKEFWKPVRPRKAPGIRDERLASLCKLSLGILAALIFVKICLVVAGTGYDFSLTWIALASATPVVLGARHRATLLRNIDWGTLAFFAAMFVLMGAVWESGIIQSAIAQTDLNLLWIPVILLVSILLSQIMSNVPLVALYLPLMLGLGAGTRELMALAAGSTIAGNLLIIGAASNVIIIQSAEKRGRDGFGFWEFAKVGAPLTLANALVYWAFLSL